MPVVLSFSFYGDTQVERTLDRFDHAEDMTPAWEAITESFVKAERRQFRTEGQYGSGGWSPLSPKYAAWKATRFPGTKILHRTGALEESLTERPLGVEVILPERMTIGSDQEHGRHHQDPKVPGRPPRRRPIELPESLRRDWVKIAQRYIVTGRVTP